MHNRLIFYDLHSMFNGFFYFEWLKYILVKTTHLIKIINIFILYNINKNTITKFH